MNDEGQQQIIFSHGGVECEQFIRWVRNTASKQGKARDNDWMIDFATGALGGDALRWYSRLDTAVSDDWRSLQRALLERYAPEDSSAHSAIIPAAAAAAPAPTSFGSVRYGRIRVIGHPKGRCYISNTMSPSNDHGVAGIATCCFEIKDAMVVRYTPSIMPHAVEVTGQKPDEAWLGIEQLREKEESFYKIGFIVLMTGPEINVVKTTFELPKLSGIVRSPHREVWNMCDLDGTIRFTLPQNGDRSLTICQVAIDDEDSHLAITSDYERFDSGSTNKAYQGRLVFESL